MRGQSEIQIEDYVGKAIKEIKGIAKLRKLCLRFSGGKDSIVTEWLLKQAGVKFQSRFSRTSVDPPELLEFIHKYHKDVIEEKPRISMYKMIIKKGFPPTRVCRYCCSEYKERNTCPREDVAVTVTGVRKEESRKRANRRKWEVCMLDEGIEFYNPVIDWTEDQIWKVIEDNHIPYCRLYDEGFGRIGCVGCPLTSSKKIKREFERWPNFEKAYLWAFEKMLEGRNFDKWKTKYDVMEWYIYGVEKRYQEIENQMVMRLDDKNQLYYGDYFDNLTYQYERRTVEDAKKILLNNN